MPRTLLLQGQESMKTGFNDLPNELISWIFRLYVKTRDVWKYRISVSYPARSLLCSVCHRWREIAIKTPQLWTSIEVGPRYPSYPPRALIKLWIKRSHPLPIYLDLHGPVSYGGHPRNVSIPRNLVNMVKLFQPELKRWKFFRPNFYNGGVDAFTKLPLETAERLEELDIVSSSSQEVNEKLFLNIARLPALKCFSWNCDFTDISIMVPSQSTISSFPWHQLHYINLSVTMSPDETCDLFAASTSADAIILNLNRKPDVPVYSNPRPLITLPNLQYLEIRSDVGMYETLQHLDLPGIKILSLHGRMFFGFYGQPRIPVKKYKEFFNRAAVSVQLVLLQSFDFWGDEVTGFFNNPLLLNIPVFQVPLYKDNVERAESALKNVLEAGGTPRVLKKVKGNAIDYYHIGWVDRGVKWDYRDCLGYGPLCWSIRKLSRNTPEFSYSYPPAIHVQASL